MNFDDYQRFERLGPVTKTKNGVTAALGAEQLQVDFVFNNAVRIRISRDGVFDERPTFALISELNLLGRIGFKVSEKNGVTTVASDSISVRLTHEPFLDRCLSRRRLGCL